MHGLVEQVLQAPDFPLLANTIHELAQVEAHKRAQFLKDITPNDKWEFINGDVIMHSPAKLKHLVITGKLFRQIGDHSDKTGTGLTLSEKCLISLTRNDFEPDIVWFSTEKAEGFLEDQMRFPAPDFIIEVLSPSTEKYDRGVKMEDYARHGVGEYWIVDPDNNTVEQYLLVGESTEYSLHEKRHDGQLSPRCMPLLKVDLDVVFA